VTVSAYGDYIGDLVGCNAGEIIDSHAIIADYVSGDWRVGGLVGDNANIGVIKNSYADGNVEGYGSVGGLAGLNEGEISNTYFTGTVTNIGTLGLSGGLYTGGLVGENRGWIESSHADATVIAPRGDYVGGLAGLSEEASIEYSGSTGTVEGRHYVGGLVGAGKHSRPYGAPRLFASYSTCLVTGERSVGGLVGSNGSVPLSGGSPEELDGLDIQQCYAKGDVQNTDDKELTYSHFGGLVGNNYGIVWDSYAWGNVEADDYAGGLIGYNGSNVFNCYTIGNVTVKESSSVGPLVGYSFPGTIISGTFWNVNTSDYKESDYGIKSDSYNMKLRDTYRKHHGDEDVEWDLDEVWGIDHGHSYPYLLWERPNEFESGTGTEEDPFIITTVEHLANVRKYLNKHFRLAAHLDLEYYRTGSGWEPIGTIDSQFTGSFDGDGCSISNLYIRKSYKSPYDTVYSGLFGFVGTGAVIRDLALENVDIQSDGVVGGLAAVNSGALEDCTVAGVVTSTGDDYYGRLVLIGGLVAENKGTIINCYADADVASGDAGDPAECVGGLAGKNHGSIYKSGSSGTVAGGNMVGGLVGLNSPEGSGTGEITECSSGSSVTGYGDYVGGLVGSSNGPITRSFAYGDVTGGHHVGGLAGWNDDKITDSYAVGDITGDDHVGGLVGHNTDLLTYCYSAGAVTRASLGHGVYFGGLVGYKGAAGGDEGNAVNCWWDMEASGQTGSANGTGKTTAEMKLKTTYENWDFVTTWDISAGLNNGYPFLRWVDEIPPVLFDVKHISATDTSAMLSFNADKSGIYYYLVFEASPIHTPPDAEEIRAQGDDCAAKGTGVAEVGENIITVTGLDPAKLYNAYFILAYNQENVSNIAQIDFDTLSENPEPAVVPLSLDITTGASGTIHVYLGNGEGAAESATVTSNDTTVATVYPSVVNTNQTVLVTGVSAGSTTVTVSFSGGYTGGDITVDVTVTDPVSYQVRFFVDNVLYDEVTVREGHAVGDNWPSNPVKSKYTFGGWFTGANGTGVEVTSSNLIHGDMDLYAKWIYKGSTGPGSGTPVIPSLPPLLDYKAEIRTGIDLETEVPIAVGDGIALIESGLPNVIPPVAVITMPPISDVNNYAVNVPVPSLLTDNIEGTLTLNTEVGSVTVLSNMLTGVAEGQEAQIAIGTGDKENLPEDVRNQVGDRPLVQLTLSIDGQQVSWNNPQAPVSVSIPYTPSPEELANPDSIVVWYIDGSGNVVCVPNGRYDSETGIVTFTTTHFSYFAVAYNKVSFNDVAPRAWYNKAVDFIAARGITTGTGGDNFSPNAKLTRAQYLVMVMRAYGIAPDENPAPGDNFADAGNVWYTGHLAAAKRLGISNGVGNNMFAPDKEITRQEMCTMLYNTLKVLGQLPQGSSGRTLSGFGDADEIASWAREAMELLVETGVVSGSDGRLNPHDTATRAEMAQLLFNLLGE
jgi:uncharacterized repeat protein (TIGR02543 family)